MPLAFSFFSKSKPSQALDSKPEPQEPIAASTLPEISEEIPSPLPALSFDNELLAEAHQTRQPVESIEEMPTLVLPPPKASQHTELPIKKNKPSRGLAALALNQSTPEAPPLNRRSTGPLPSPFADNKGTASIHLNSKAETPSTGSAKASPNTSSPSENQVDMGEQIREQLHQEIEQVKNDLFGAVMGVSALKDRLDGLESQLSEIQAQRSTNAQNAPSSEQLHEWANRWMKEHFPDLLDQAMQAAHDRLLGSLSTTDYFYPRGRISPEARQSLMTFSPKIITSLPA